MSCGKDEHVGYECNVPKVKLVDDEVSANKGRLAVEIDGKYE